ncbi:MAG: gamma-glutamyl-gamma-aminobutyrate hydrolase family protein [Candidatus Brocadiales bacterium]
MKPIIGINSDYQDGKYFSKKEYTEAIALAGGVPLILPIVEDKELIARQVNLIDGLLLSGGKDILPERYGETSLKKTKPVPEQKDDFDFQLAKKALDTNIPIFGICYGLQLINVGLGGSLIQDIPSQHETSINHRTDTHNVCIDKTSRLYKISKRKTIKVNSTHHQAIKSLGNKLRVSAVADDGIIEAIESTDHTFVVGVQWHPEEIIRRKTQLELFKTLVSIASPVRERRGNKPHSKLQQGKHL